uniref:Uncharacterized protein n=1 Tax=Papilio xuthus TaxID=66420 RepID=I4DQK4_PAPXU|nr:unknown unsecreted protein [Papilio xuthus]
MNLLQLIYTKKHNISRSKPKPYSNHRLLTIFFFVNETGHKYFDLFCPSNL